MDFKVFVQYVPVTPKGVKGGNRVTGERVLTSAEGLAILKVKEQKEAEEKQKIKHNMAEKKKKKEEQKASHNKMKCGKRTISQSKGRKKTKLSILASTSTSVLTPISDSVPSTSISVSLSSTSVVAPSTSNSVSLRSASNSVSTLSTTVTVNTWEKEKKTLVLPYVKGLIVKITSHCRNIGVRTTFISKSTLRNLLTHVKSKIPPENRVGVIYLIPCECGAVYIGETGRNIKFRLQEHTRAVNKGDKTIACHQMTTGHNIIKWEDSRVLEQESNLQRRQIKETIYIRTTANTMNTDPGLDLNPTWTLDRF